MPIKRARVIETLWSPGAPEEAMALQAPTWRCQTMSIVTWWELRKSLWVFCVPWTPGSLLFLAATAMVCQLSCRPEEKKQFLARLGHINIALPVILDQNRQASSERPCVPLGTLWTSLVAGSTPWLSLPAPHSSGGVIYCHASGL